MKKKETETFVDDDDIAHDMEILAMWERGEHTCEMYDAFCAVCEKDQKGGGQDIEADRRLLTELLEERARGAGGILLHRFLERIMMVKSGKRRRQT